MAVLSLQSTWHCIGWCKSEYDRSLFDVYYLFLCWKTTESCCQLLETPMECPRNIRWHLEVPRQLNHAFRGFCQFWHQKSPKSCSLRLRSAHFTEIGGQVTRLAIFLSAVNFFWLLVFSAPPSDPSFIPLNRIRHQKIENFHFSEGDFQKITIFPEPIMKFPKWPSGKRKFSFFDAGFYLGQ